MYLFEYLIVDKIVHVYVLSHLLVYLFCDIERDRSEEADWLLS